MAVKMILGEYAYGGTETKGETDIKAEKAGV
jgi:hypothetical protein